MFQWNSLDFGFVRLFTNNFGNLTNFKFFKTFKTSFKAYEIRYLKEPFASVLIINWIKKKFKFKNYCLNCGLQAVLDLLSLCRRKVRRLQRSENWKLSLFDDSPNGRESVSIWQLEAAVLLIVNCNKCRLHNMAAANGVVTAANWTLLGNEMIRRLAAKLDGRTAMCRRGHCGELREGMSTFRNRFEW